MSEIRKLIVIFVITAIMIVAWQFFGKNNLTQQKTVAGGSNIIQLGGKVELIDRNEAIKRSTKRVYINAPKVNGSIDLTGLKFNDLTLKEFKQEQDGEELVHLLNPVNSFNGQVMSLGWLADNNIKMPDSNSVWQADSDLITMNNPVELTWDNGSNITFKLQLFIDQNYMLQVKQKIINNSNENLVIAPYAVLAQYKKRDELPEKFAILHQGLTGIFDQTLDEMNYEEIRDSRKVEYKKINKGWLALTDKYWLTSVVPDARYSFDASFLYKNIGDLDKYQVDYVSQKIMVKPSQTLNYNNLLYAGVKKLNLLDHYEKQFGINKFDLAIDFGWLYVLTKPMIICLQFFHKLVGHFAIAILLLTVVIKLIMLPLANKSFRSMAKIKALQPTVKNLQNKYADDKMRFNYELMQLYKKEKVNPLTGCLPLLVQIPVFFALYKVLFVSIEMRHESFLWISDLSLPDPTSLFNLFGLLPFAVPAFLKIGILPILMGISMFLQQKFNPKATDPMQEKVMKLMPVIFTFMFYRFPAGLVLYWVWNNVLSILQQIYIQKSLVKETERF